MQEKLDGAGAACNEIGRCNAAFPGNPPAVLRRGNVPPASGRRVSKRQAATPAVPEPLPPPRPAMNRLSRKSAPISVVWQAAERAPRGWMAWLKRLLGGYLAGLGQARAGVTLLVSGDAGLRDLNAAYRGRRRTTDILSFSYLDAPPRRAKAVGRSAAFAPGGRAFRAPRKRSAGSAARPLQGSPLGELAVSWDRVRAQARANGWDVRTEMARLLAHGCAHLAGYDHATRAGDVEMRRIEERLLKAAGYTGLYP